MQADPAVDSIAMFIGGGGTALNSGRMYVTLKPQEQRDANAQQIIARLRPKFEKVEGARLYHAGVTGRAPRRPRHAHEFEFTLQDANLDELNEWAPKILAGCRPCRNCATLPPTSRPGHHADADDRSRYRVALRHPAAIDRRHAVRRLRPAAGHPVFHPAQQLSRHPGDPAGLQGDPDTLDKLYIKSPLTGNEVPLSAF